MTDTIGFETLDDEMTAFLADPSQFPDPFPFFHRMRTFAPVYRSSIGLWVVTSFAEGNTVFRNSAFGRATAGEAQLRPFAAGGDPKVVQAVRTYGANVLAQDPPDHTRLRRLMARVFTPKAIALWRPRVEEVVDRLVDRALERGDIDFISDFAYALPEAVACELLGVPASDHDLWSQWTVTLTQPAVYTRGTASGADPSAGARTTIQQALVEADEYFRDLVAERRGQRRDDLLSMLIEAEEQGDRLSEEELVGNLTLLILAGHHTTANLLGNGMLALLRNPEQLALLRADPSLVDNAVEELLRYDGPGRSMPRVPAEDFRLGDVTIEAGDAVTVLLSAGNRDPLRFEDPDSLDITRSDVTHLGFGAGLHFCLGAPLARLEAGIALSAIARRIGSITLLDDDVEWRPSYVRGLEALSVRCAAN